jgi:hypothetical protein
MNLKLQDVGDIGGLNDLIRDMARWYDPQKQKEENRLGGRFSSLLGNVSA